MARTTDAAFLVSWNTARGSKHRGEAETLFKRIRAIAPKAELSVDKHGIIGFGRGADNFPLVCMTIRADGLRFYASPPVLAKQKAKLGKHLTGKSCVTLKRSAELDDALLTRIVEGSLAANLFCPD
jgi:hypothetical protein